MWSLCLPLTLYEDTSRRKNIFINSILRSLTTSIILTPFCNILLYDVNRNDIHNVRSKRIITFVSKQRYLSETLTYNKHICVNISPANIHSSV
jgi:hypothetical protein